MDPRRFAQILGKVSSHRGRNNEKRVLDACALPARPAWMHMARAATRTEDHAGIDIVVESDVGKLYVQVKSSKNGKAAYRERRRSARAVVVVVRSSDSQEDLLRKVVGELSKVRADYIEKRNGAG